MGKDAHLFIVAHFFAILYETRAELSTVVLQNIVTFKRLHILIQDVGYHLRIGILSQLVLDATGVLLAGIIFVG